MICIFIHLSAFAACLNGIVSYQHGNIGLLLPVYLVSITRKVSKVLQRFIDIIGICMDRLVRLDFNYS